MPVETPGSRPDTSLVQAQLKMSLQYRVAVKSSIWHLTHGHQPVVQGVNLHEVGLQEILNSFDALLRVLLLGRILVCLRATPLLQSPAQTSILWALVTGGRNLCVTMMAADQDVRYNP